MSRSVWLVRSVAFFGSVVVLAPGAGAELLRCKGPDGRIIYTDQAARCPGSEPFEPSGAIQKAPSVAPAPDTPRPRSPHDLVEDAERARAARWAAKKRAAEEELEQVTARQEWLREYITHCNRGGYVTTRDDAGIKHTIPCDAFRRDSDALAQREAELRTYLQSGLQEECRRAGCLPGWIR